MHVDAPVLIVGAGPTGMTAALTLASFGVRSLVLEAADELSQVGSKAICVQRDVLAVLDRLADADALVRRGVSWTLGRTYFGDAEVFQTRFPDVGPGAYPPFINVSQADTEAHLHAALLDADEVELRFGHRVVGVADLDGGVEVDVETGAGRTTLRGTYLVACDGGRSSVRELLGIDFPGHSHTDRFIIADIRAQLDFPDERRFFFDPPFNPGRQVLVHPQPDDVWRIDWQVPPEVDAEEELADGRLDARIRAVVGDVEYELVWLSSYRFHQRVAERFRAGAVLLAGDAAHLMAPFGARGMNSGIMDAENLGWKLALVLRGEADDRLLDTYETERRGAARENIRVTDRTMRFMVPRNRFWWALRDVLLRLSVRARWLRRFVNSGRLAEPFEYGASGAVVPAPGQDPPDEGLAARLARLLDGRSVRAPVAPRPGSLAPDGPVLVDGAPRRLRELLGRGFVALSCGPAPAWVAPDDEPDDAPAAPLRFVELVRAAPATAPPRGVARVHAEPALWEALTGDGDAPPAFLLLRPDGYVAARREQLPTRRDVADLVRAIVREPAASPVATGRG